MSPSSVRALWSKLASAGLTVGDMPEAEEAHTPWYVRVMLGIAGLIAAGFLLGFVGAGFAFVMESKAASFAVGLVLITAAYVVFRTGPRTDFTSMFALAVSFAGQGLVIFSVFLMSDGMPWATIAAMEAVLAVAMPNFIHRAVSAYAAGLCFAYACAVSGVNIVAAGVVAAAVAFVWTKERRSPRTRSCFAIASAKARSSSRPTPSFSRKAPPGATRERATASFASRRMASCC